MSKIDELINELCIQGVEFASLGELCSIRTGSQLNKEKLNDDGKYPVFNGGIYPSGYHNDFNTEANTIAISQGGASAGYVNWVDVPFFAGAHCYTIKNISEKVLNRYLYFFLKNEQNNIQNSKQGAGIPGLNRNVIKDLLIPIPPLPVQHEIVRILDNFTELTAELTAELTVRKKQYEYYNNRLLSLEKYPYMQLSQICEIVDYRGKTPKKVEDGIYLVTAKNIKKGFIDYEASKEYVSHEDYNIVMRRGFPKLGDVLITTEAPCGNVAQVNKEDIALAQRVIKYRPNEAIMLSSFLKFILLGKEFQDKLASTSTGGTVKGIKGSKLHKMTVPVPPLKQQARIVSILERFDTLVNDIKQGLPAEIAARQKQYEYYRDKLLTFKEVGNESI